MLPFECDRKRYCLCYRFLGDSRAGLEILTKNLEHIIDKEYFVSRHQLPAPRVNLGEKLSQFDRVALNDISDGIASELNEIAIASDVDIEIDDALIPTHPSFSQFSRRDQFNWKYFGGEDFELAGTIAPHHIPRLQELSEQLELPITIIGKVRVKQATEPTVFLKKDGKMSLLYKKGYTHLEKDNGND